MAALILLLPALTAGATFFDNQTSYPSACAETGTKTYTKQTCSEECTNWEEDYVCDDYEKKCSDCWCDSWSRESCCRGDPSLCEDTTHKDCVDSDLSTDPYCDSSSSWTCEQKNCNNWEDWWVCGDGHWEETCTNYETTCSNSTQSETVTRDTDGRTCGTNKECESGTCVLQDVNPPSTTPEVDGAPVAAPAWFVDATTISLMATDDASGIDHIDYCLGTGCTPENGKTGTSVTLDADGRHTLRFHATDNYGRTEETKNITIGIDTGAPATSVNATISGTSDPYPGGWVSSPVDLDVHCTDTVSGCRTGSRHLRLIGTPGTCPGAGNRKAATVFDQYDITPPHTLVSDGTHHVCAGAKDVASNTGFGGASPEAQEIKIDTTDPVITVSTTSPSSDDEQPVQYTVEEKNLQDCTAIGGDVSWTCSETDDNSDDTYEGTCTPNSAMSDGSRTVAVTCEDDAGNTGSNSTPVTVDTTPPSITCDDCDSPDPIKNGNRVTFDPDVTDATTTVDTIVICADATCTDVLCTGQDCSYRTPENTYITRDYWIRAVDTVGNTRVQGPPTKAYNFTIKRGLDEACQTSDACLIGQCVDDTCTTRTIRPPSIRFSALTDQLPGLTGAAATMSVNTSRTESDTRLLDWIDAVLQ